MSDLITTPALILKYTNVGEADRLYHMITRAKGRIVTRATGVRYLKSKLRFQLQPTELVVTSLIEGNRGYRLVNAYGAPSQSRVPSSIKIPFLILVDRLVQGETSEQQLYDHIERVLISRASIQNHADERGFYGSASLLLLSILGYYLPSADIYTTMENIIDGTIPASELMKFVADPGALIKSLIISTQM